MKLAQKELEEWIKPFATIVGDLIEVDEKLKAENSLRYFLKKTIPNKFESYAVALHSFWINKAIPIENIRESKDEDEDLPEDEFDRVKWNNYYAHKGEPFDIKNLYKSGTHFYKQFNQMNNELFPGEGLMDKEHLNSLIEIVLEKYGDQEIEVFYTFLATSDWEKDRMYSGKITGLNKLLGNEELRLTPSLIYPKDRKWVVIRHNQISKMKQEINRHMDTSRMILLGLQILRK